MARAIRRSSLEELGVDDRLAGWFSPRPESSYTLVTVRPDHLEMLTELLGVPVRRCYVSDQVLAARSAELHIAQTEILEALLPTPGSTMSGDFGEIVVALFQASEQGGSVLEPKKWRLKQDRTKPAPYSDVVQFVVPNWPAASAEDWILCAEVKSKATAGAWSPIAAAVDDSTKDRVGRLAKTLVWLRERAMLTELGTVTLAHLDRFINLSEFPPAQRRFSAVAVISADLVDNELLEIPDSIPDDCGVIVLSVPQLKVLYEAVFDGVQASLGGA